MDGWLFTSSVLLDRTSAATSVVAGVAKDREGRHFKLITVCGNAALILAGLRKDDICSMIKGLF